MTKHTPDFSYLRGLKPLVFSVEDCANTANSRRDKDSRIRAVAAEEAARKERERCADRAVKFVEKFNDEADEGAGDFWTTADLRAAILTSDSASEPRTCETCDAGPLPGGVPCSDWRPRKPAFPRDVSAEDVETVRSKVREAFDLGVRHGKWLATYTGPIGILHRVDDIDGQLDRISGKDR